MNTQTDLLSKKLKALKVGRVYDDQLLKNHCTWCIGGPADVIAEPETADQLCLLRKFIYDNEINSIVIGQGSNLLFDDRGFRGIVIKIGRFLSNFCIEDKIIRAETGVAVPRLARVVGLSGLTGIEHIIGIPGTLGGLVAMNGGSRRKSVGEVINFVEAVDCCGDIRKINKDQCGFSYRKSVFQESDLIMVRIEIELEYDDPAVIRNRLLKNLRERRQKFPRREPNCGSVFLSTKDLYEQVGSPGKVIEDACLKGLSIGGAQVSNKHANFIINTGTATAADVKELIEKIKKIVYNKTGQQLQCEVKYIYEKPKS